MSSNIKQTSNFNIKFKYTPLLMYSYILLSACNQSTKQDNSTTIQQITSETYEEFTPEAITKDSVIVAYIRNHDQYVALADKIKLPEIVKDNYPGILEFMRNNNMDVNNYYVDTTYIRSGSPTILIPIYHYNGFIVAKDLEEKNAQAELESKKTGKSAAFTQINGNLSGMDGFLEIDKITRKVVSFGLWQ